MAPGLTAGASANASSAQAYEAVVKDELVQAVRDLGPASTPYTVTDAVRAWLAKSTKNNGADTVDGYPRLTNQHLIPED